MLTVEQLRKKLRGADPKALVAVQDHDNYEDELNGFVQDVAFGNVEDFNSKDGGWAVAGPVVTLRL